MTARAASFFLARPSRVAPHRRRAFLQSSKSSNLKSQISNLKSKSRYASASEPSFALTAAMPAVAVNAASHNQDFTYVALATSRGYVIHSALDGQRYHGDDALGGLKLVEMLFTSSLLCVVGDGDSARMSPRRVKILDARCRRVLGEIACASTVLAVRLNRARVIARERTRCTIYELGTLARQQTIDTVACERGLVALSADAESSVLAFAGSASEGKVVVHDALNLCGICEVRAHRTPLAALALNADGTMLATASVKGTVIRVTALPSGTKMWSFRRGATSSVIQSLNFGATAFQPPLLCVSSDKGTAHVFAIEGEPKECESFEDRVGETIDGARETSNGESADDVAPTVLSTAATTVSNALAKSRAGVFGKLANAAGATVRGISSRVKPVKMFAAARNAMEPSRAIATVKLPHTSSTKWSLCALQPTPGTAADKWAPPSLDSSQPARQLEAQVSVVTSDAVFYDYNVRLTSDRAGFFSRGEEAVARLERECKLIDETDSFGTSSTVGDLPSNGRWIESAIAAGSNPESAQELRTNVSESMSQSMFG